LWKLIKLLFVFLSGLFAGWVNIVAVYKFKKMGIPEWKKAFKVSLHILLGAIMGSSRVVSIL